MIVLSKCFEVVVQYSLPYLSLYGLGKVLVVDGNLQQYVTILLFAP